MLPIESVWIEAEEWAARTWDPLDCNSDVLVLRGDGSRWVATFFSYANIRTLAEKNRRTGECLSGAYLWASDMVLVDQVTRARIVEVIDDLLRDEIFEQVFVRIPDGDDTSDGAEIAPGDAQ